MLDELGSVNAFDRRALLRRSTGAALGLGALGALGAPVASAGAPSAVRKRSRAIVGDVVRYALSSDAWEGEFGFVVMRLHRADVDGQEAYFIRTDTSDQAYAREQRLVWAPKIAPLKGSGLSGGLYTVEGGTPDQQLVLSSEPGRPDYTPAWLIHRVRWQTTPRRLTSVTQIESARNGGELTVAPTDIVVNAAVVKWSAGELAVDRALREYHGGQLIERPNTNAMTVMFKLHQCYPGSRYIVTDHSLDGPAEATKTIYAPRLQTGPTKAGATGRVNPFLNGLKGDGPFGFQPSVFDSRAGTPAWSPYWDHYAYQWRRSGDARLLRSEAAINAARRRGDLRRFVGVPDTKGTLFTVNCQVPVIAPTTYRAPRGGRRG